MHIYRSNYAWDRPTFLTYSKVMHSSCPCSGFNCNNACTKYYLARGRYQDKAIISCRHVINTMNLIRNLLPIIGKNLL